MGSGQVRDSITPGMNHLANGAGLLSSQCLPHRHVGH
jgi:hypothetical protein